MPSPAATTSGPKYGTTLNTPAAMAHTQGCVSPIAQSATPVATPTRTLVKICTSRKRSICTAMSLRIWTVIFFCDSRGPMFSTSFRLKRSS